MVLGEEGGGGGGEGGGLTEVNLAVVVVDGWMGIFDGWLDG